MVLETAWSYGHMVGRLACQQRSMPVCFLSPPFDSTALARTTLQVRPGSTRLQVYGHLQSQQGNIYSTNTAPCPRFGKLSTTYRSRRQAVSATARPNPTHCHLPTVRADAPPSLSSTYPAILIPAVHASLPYNVGRLGVYQLVHRLMLPGAGLKAGDAVRAVYRGTALLAGTGDGLVARAGALIVQ